MTKAGEIVVKYSIIVFPVLMFVATLAVNRFFILTEQPDDGIHYVWLAKLMSNGKFYLDLPEFHEHYTAPFMFMYHDKYTSIFLPGFSLFMAPFAKFGLEYLFNPLLAGINTFLVGIHAEKLKNRTAAFAAMLMFSLSTTHILHGAYYFPHHFGLMLVLISSYLIVNKSSNLLNFFWSGLIVAISLLIRTQNAFYVYAAFIIFILFRDKSLKKAALFTLPFIVFGMILAGYNWFFTGNPFIFTQDVVFNTLDLKEFCHRPGLGKGCTIVSPVNAPNPLTGTTIPFLAHISFLRLNNFVHRITFHQIVLIFIFPAIISRPYKYFLYYFTPLCALAFYFWFFIEGNYAGPRYLIESGAMMLIVAGCGFVEFLEYLRNKNNKLSEWSAVFLKAVLMGSAVFFTFFILPHFFYRNFGSDNPEKIKKLIENNHIENSILLLPEHGDFHFESILKFHKNPPFDENGNLVIYSKGKMDENLLKYYTKNDFKSVWKIEIESEEYYQQRIFRAKELDFIEDDGISYVNFGKKITPTDGQPTLAYILDNSYNKIAEDFLGHYLSKDFKFDEVGLFMIFGDLKDDSYYGFEHSLKDGGFYDLKLTMIPTKCTSNFYIEINGIKSAGYIHENTEGDGQPHRIYFNAEMNKGRNKFKIVPESKGCLILSDMILKKR
ncbi:hypothetical protein J5681_02440 [bacterium]|nr:hypothetical protein [bacterium]